MRMVLKLMLLQGKLEYVENVFLSMDRDGDGEVTLQGHSNFDLKVVLGSCKKNTLTLRFFFFFVFVF